MYQKGDQVLYGAHGICIVAGVEVMRFGKTKAEYFVLQPLAQLDARFYVPVANEAAVAKLQPLKTEKELLELLHSEQVRSTAFVNDENQRKLRYRELINSGDREALLGMICALHRHKKAQEAAGRKFHQSDENFLHDAEKLLNAEFAQVFCMDPKNVNAFIRKELEQD